MSWRSSPQGHPFHEVLIATEKKSGIAEKSFFVWSSIPFDF